MKQIRSKKTRIKPRASVVEEMILHCKPWSPRNEHKFQSKKECRNFRRMWKELV
jgi:hypothetical protein